MHATTFDTLEFTEQLKAAGVPDEQAKGHAKALVSVMRQANARVDEQAGKRDQQTTDRLESLAEKNEQQVQSRLDGLATKQDLAVGIKELELRLAAKMEASKVDTIKWTAGMFAAQTALIIGALFAVLKMNQPATPPVYPSPTPELRQSVPLPAPPVALQPVAPSVAQ